MDFGKAGEERGQPLGAPRCRVLHHDGPMSTTHGCELSHFMTIYAYVDFND